MNPFRLHRTAPPSMRALVAVFGLLAWISALSLPLSEGRAGTWRAPDPIEKQGKLCARAITNAERHYRIPRQLLAAISIAESGRYSKARRATFAWPWTVRSGKFSSFLPNRAAAIDTVRQLQARGIRNIDVGCMQVNLSYHPKAFADLRAAFDPAHNVYYAAGFLTRLQRTKRSWSRAVGLYHSAKPEKSLPYWRRVMRLWGKERRRAAKERRRRVIAGYEDRRQKRLAAQARRRARLALRRHQRR
jgi:hypothetical protein